MKSFRIVFYKSEEGELIKIKEFVKEAVKLQDLIQDPPDEFFEMLKNYAPVHGWAEMEPVASTVFVIFTERSRKLPEENDEDFKNWLAEVRPSDFGKIE